MLGPKAERKQKVDHAEAGGKRKRVWLDTRTTWWTKWKLGEIKKATEGGRASYFVK